MQNWNFKINFSTTPLLQMSFLKGLGFFSPLLSSCFFSARIPFHLFYPFLIPSHFSEFFSPLFRQNITIYFSIFFNSWFFLGARFMGSFLFSCTFCFVHLAFPPRQLLFRNYARAETVQRFNHPSSLPDAATPQRMRCNTGAGFSSFFLMNSFFFLYGNFESF